MVGHGTCAHNVAVREVGKKCQVLMVSVVRGSSYLLRILKCWGGNEYWEEIQMLESHRESDKFAAVRMREFGIFFVYP